jgi:HEAT repeat protein
VAALTLAAVGARAAEPGPRLGRDYPYWRGGREVSPGPYLCVAPAAEGVTVVSDRWPDGSDLRRFGLDAARLSGAKTDHDRAIAVWRWVRRWKLHTDGNPPTESFRNPVQSAKRGYIDDPLKVLNVYGTHWCDGLSRVVEAVWRAMGYRAEKLVLGSHTLAHCRYRDVDGVYRWHLFDVNYGAYIPDRTRTRVLGADGLCTDYCKDYSQWEHSQHLDMPTHRMELSFRRGEKLERIWGNWGKPYQDNVDVERDRRRVKAFERGPYEPAYGNGRWTYAPDLGEASWTDGLAEPPAGLQRSKLAPAAPGKPGTAVWRFRTPYIVSDAEVQLRFFRASAKDAVRLHLSVDDGRTWKPVWECPPAVTGEQSLTVPICAKFEVKGKTNPPEGFNSPFGRYHYRLRLELVAAGRPQDCRIEGIRFATTVQQNYFSLPQLQPGRNRITVKGDLREGAALKITYAWRDLKGRDRRNVTVAEKLPCTYEILADGAKWEDVVCERIDVEAISRTGRGNHTVLKEEPSEVREQPAMRPPIETLGRGGPWRRPDAAGLPPVKTLVEQLKDPKKALAAVGALAECRAAEAFDPLKDIVYNDDRRNVKEAAISALYIIDAEKARPVLLEILEHPEKAKWTGYKTWKGKTVTDGNRWAAAALIVGTIAQEAGWKEAVPGLVRVAESEHATAAVKWSVMRIFSHIGDGRTSAVVGKCLRARDGNVSAYAALAAGRTGDASLVPLLREKLKQGNWVVVRERAAVALGMLGDAASAPELEAMLSFSGNENIRAAAAGALGTMKHGPSLPALKRALESEPVPWVREVMTEAVDRISPPAPDDRKQGQE